MEDLLDPLGRGLVGGIFGLLVLAPFNRSTSWPFARTIGLVLGSMLTYALVVQLAIESYGPMDLDENVAVVLSGIIGALLVGVLIRMVAMSRVPARTWLLLAAAGTVGGVVFSLLFESDFIGVVAIGYLAWQLPVFGALYYGTGQ